MLVKMISTLWKQMSECESGSYSGKWQATWDLPTVNSSGVLLRQISWAFQHLVLNTQPAGGLIGEGRSPLRMIRSLLRSDLGSGCGTADNNAVVYGWCGAEKRSSVFAISIILPKYITATRSEICWTTDKSWAIKTIEMPSAFCKSSIRLIFHKMPITN